MVSYKTIDSLKWRQQMKKEYKIKCTKDKNDFRLNMENQRIKENNSILKLLNTARLSTVLDTV